MDNTKPIGEAVNSAVAALQSQSTRQGKISDLEHKRAFLNHFQRWEILFKRKDGGNVQAEKWLIAEYYDSLRHLSNEGLNRLTNRLKETCTFFPSIRECLEATKAGPYDYGHPFFLATHIEAYSGPSLFNAPSSPLMIGSSNE